MTSISSSITCRRFEARNVDINGEEAVIPAKLRNKISTKVPLFAASFSVVVTEGEAPGDESWNH